jgi:mannitol/fructose-specific phosphotransferase system IIA component (Ntr-type)
MRLAADIEEIEALREGAVGLDEIVIPHTRPERVQELTHFGEK